MYILKMHLIYNSMTINSVALIAGTLSFSAALAWNKAVGDTLLNYTKTNSPILQAVIITIVIIILVYLINVSIKFYTNITGNELKDSVIKAGGNNDSKVKLWDKIII